MGHIGQKLINAVYQREVSLSDTPGIVAGKPDLYGVVNVIPVRMMILLLSAVRHVAHELPGSLEVGKLKVSG